MYRCSAKKIFRELGALRGQTVNEIYIGDVPLFHISTIYAATSKCFVNFFTFLKKMLESIIKIAPNSSGKTTNRSININVNNRRSNYSNNQLLPL